MFGRDKIIKDIFERHGDDALYITTTGYISRAVYNLFPEKKNIFYMQGSMGLSPAIGLGLASNCDKNVVVLSGDASLLMHLGITHTIRENRFLNLNIYVLDNECNESVGGQECPKLNSFYSGITKIYKINKEGPRPRVSLSCTQIKENFMKEVKNEK